MTSEQLEALTEYIRCICRQEAEIIETDEHRRWHETHVGLALDALKDAFEVGDEK